MMTSVLPVSGESGTLRIVRLMLQARALYRMAGRTGLLQAQWGQGSRADMGYVVHAALRAAFGENAPKPYYVLSSRERETLARIGVDVADKIIVLGYGDEYQAERWQADSDRNDLVDWEQFEVKTMRSSFVPGTRLRFVVRVCPVVRTRLFREHDGENSAELDAFVAAYRYYENGKREGPPDRVTVYRDWIVPKLEAGGVSISSLRISGFQLTDVTRRDNQRELKAWRRPVAECEGTLTVTDQDAFESLLRSGVGRHRAFGFGMLRIFPS